MVLEYAQYGSMENYLESQNCPGELEDDHLVQLAFDCVKGMVYLQSRNIIHRDLASRNVLIDSAKHAKVRCRDDIYMSDVTYVSR